MSARGKVRRYDQGASRGFSRTPWYDLPKKFFGRESAGWKAYQAKRIAAHEAAASLDAKLAADKAQVLSSLSRKRSRSSQE